MGDRENRSYLPVSGIFATSACVMKACVKGGIEAEIDGVLLSIESRKSNIR